MDDCNLKTLLNLTGGNSQTLPATRNTMSEFGAKFLTAAEPIWSRASEPGYAQWQVEELNKCKQEGAVTLKILKTLGLYLRENGKLVAIDDACFDPMWDAAGSLDLPVMIHTADPGAFFTPIPTCMWTSRRGWENSAGSRALRGDFSSATRTASCSPPTPAGMPARNFRNRI